MQFDDSVELINYSDYQPQNLHLGQPHPDTLIESSSLLACKLPELRYALSLPKEVAAQRKLSGAQLETISYAAQLHQSFLANGQRK